ncbi:hypothetical protein KY290_031403 [Solanum tuberosum]|uniref:Uncharacterized protein n=1 Tax=Solanum tuberosum TaxID=4113 RepID=A0ABQ7U924_SOLTU|nr:hypothetical protein KY289_030795 [Solanum tuberosum]KAH0743410.1 hypothetical protein KY290_031403 [Solanum tuberosum]
MTSSKLRHSCSFPILLLTFLNFILFILSAASIAPIVFLKTPPTSLALFTKEKSSLLMLKSPRDPREAKSCWVRDYESVEAEREAWSRKRNQRIAKVQQECMENANKICEMKDKEFDDKIKNKYGQWVKNDFEG